MDENPDNTNGLSLLKEKLESLQHVFSKSEIDKNLRSLIIDELQKVIHNELQKNPTSGAIMYFARLSNELIDDLRRQGPSTQTVDNVLLSMDFNFRGYFNNYIGRLSNSIREEDTLTGKLEALAFEYRKINQVQCETDLRYTTSLPPLKDIIGNWVSEEINYLDRKRLLTAMAPRHESQASNEFRLALDMSVAQFTCLIRSLVERKLILNSNLTELAGFLSRVVVTKRSENISEGSFRRKYYNIEESTKRGVIEMLNKTIDWLMKN